LGLTRDRRTTTRECPMGKRLLFRVSTFGILLVAATSRSDVAVDTSTTTTGGTGADAPPEPITGAPAVSAPGGESVVKDPFAPYDIGSGGAWSYQQLTPAERAVVDKGLDTTGWDKVNNGFAQASRELAKQAAADSAAAQLGVED